MTTETMVTPVRAFVASPLAEAEADELGSLVTPPKTGSSGPNGELGLRQWYEW
jgi:hypothetical protein